MLVEDGILRPEKGEFKVVRPLTSTDPNERYDPLFTVFVRWTANCACRDAAVAIRPRAHRKPGPAPIIVPRRLVCGGRQLYAEFLMRDIQSRLGETLQAAIATLSAGARLRVLEVGAGTGGTTSYVLPLLPADRVVHVHRSLAVVSGPRHRFAAYPFMRRAVLDIERDPASQGFESAAYDIVIAANAIHATADLR